MAKFQATLMHGNREAVGEYSFEGPIDLMSQPPEQVMQTFMAAMDKIAHLGHIDYALESVEKMHDGTVVSAVGTMTLHGTPEGFRCLVKSA
ncbi:MAG: hypothetical protein ACRBB0_02515 [Pelagimonas sp.]|uniref:hypothetical protein n=1 Tax=Pelagimonas sp. TaxID=2073170 RepID=UPI003D6BC627